MSSKVGTSRVQWLEWRWRARCRALVSYNRASRNNPSDFAHPLCPKLSGNMPRIPQSMAFALRHQPRHRRVLVDETRARLAAANVVMAHARRAPACERVVVRGHAIAKARLELPIATMATPCCLASGSLLARVTLWCCTVGLSSAPSRALWLMEPAVARSNRLFSAQPRFSWQALDASGHLECGCARSQPHRASFVPPVRLGTGKPGRNHQHTPTTHEVSETNARPTRRRLMGTVGHPTPDRLLPCRTAPPTSSLLTCRCSLIARDPNSDLVSGKRTEQNSAPYSACRLAKLICSLRVGDCGGFFAPISSSSCLRGSGPPSSLKAQWVRNVDESLGNYCRQCST